MSTQSPDTQTKWLEIVAAAILAVSSLLTAWSSFQATQWTRTQGILANRVITILVESSKLLTMSSQDTLVDVVTFTNWLEAFSTQNDALADFYRNRFREEFKPAFEAWLALQPLKNPDAPSSPFAMTEYQPTRRQAASDLEDQAAELQADVRAASDNAAFYVRNTLYLASALFFVGMSRMFSTNKVRLAIVVLGAILMLVGTTNVITGPIA